MVGAANARRASPAWQTDGAQCERLVELDHLLLVRREGPDPAMGERGERRIVRVRM